MVVQPFQDYNIINLRALRVCCSYYIKGPILLAWILGGDLVATHIRGVSWRLARSPGSRGNFLGDFCQSPAGHSDVSATSPRPAGDQGD